MLCTLAVILELLTYSRSQNNMNNKYLKPALLVLIIVISVIALYLIKENRPSGVDPMAEFPIQHQLVYEFRAQNTTPRIVQKAEVRAFLSSDKSATQIVTNITSSTEHKLFTGGIGNKFLQFKFKDVAAGGGQKISIQADLGQANKPDTDTEKRAARYLQEEPILKIEEEELKAILEVIKAKKTGNANADILAWMKDDYPQKVEAYKKQNSEKGADIMAMPAKRERENLKGSQAASLGDVYLFVALSRASEIPARLIVGAKIAEQSNNEYVDTKLLMRPEVFSENAWHAVDLNEFSVSESNTDFVALRTIDRVLPPEISTIEAFLFDAVSIKIVPGSVKLRVRSIKK